MVYSSCTDPKLATTLRYNEPIGNNYSFRKYMF
jgi:hypothetical protein